MRLFSCFFYLGFFFFSFHADAGNYEYNGECKFVGYTEEFEQCLDSEFKKYDDQLNVIYSSVVKALPDRKFIEIEKTWIKFKEYDCHYMAREVNGGVDYISIYKACLINKTKARIHELKRSFFYSGWFEKNT